MQSFNMILGLQKHTVSTFILAIAFGESDIMIEKIKKEAFLCVMSENLLYKPLSVTWCAEAQRFLGGSLLMNFAGCNLENYQKKVFFGCGYLNEDFNRS